MDKESEHSCYTCEHFHVYDDGDGRVDESCDLDIVGCWEEYGVYQNGCDRWKEEEE